MSASRTDPIRTTVRVRYGETDQMGIVYHANYVPYFEIGRTEFMRERGVTYAEMEKNGLQLAVVEVGARFLRPARYDQVITLETRLTKTTHVQLRFEHRIFGPQPDAPEKEPLLCEGLTVLACINADGRPLRIPSPWRELIDSCVAPEDETGSLRPAP